MDDMSRESCKKNRELQSDPENLFATMGRTVVSNQCGKIFSWPCLIRKMIVPPGSMSSEPEEEIEPEECE
jgi:hypothetical protein